MTDDAALTAATARRLRVLREACGFSQTQVARELGIPQTTLGQWERGVTMIPHVKVLALLARYRVDAGEFVAGRIAR